MPTKTCNRTPHIFTPGTRVIHMGSPEEPGTIVELDTNLIDLGYTSTTCTVLWDGCDEVDIQWTNKLYALT